MSKIKIGDRFSKLITLEKVRNDNHGNAYWKCKCDCGNELVIIAGSLLSGNTKSCGCLHKKIIQNLFTRHGKSRTYLYRVWGGIIQRCNNPKATGYKHYGGRGIKVCSEWLKFENFYSDMANSYKKGLYIDRIDNDGNYEPKNCKWSTIKEQQNNRRDNIK